MDKCPCGTQVKYSNCCFVYHASQDNPRTAEALMRARYSAYVLNNIDFVKKTMLGTPLDRFNEVEASIWAKSVTWLGLDIIRAFNESDNLGQVEFIARYIEQNQQHSLHEISKFHRIRGMWYYVDAIYPNSDKAILSQKIGRNQLCPCDSRKKFKHCHGKGLN